MAEANPSSHEQGPNIQEGVQQIVDAVKDALQGRQDAVNDAQGVLSDAQQAANDAHDNFDDARRALREGGVGFAGELRTGGDALYTAADQLDPPAPEPVPTRRKLKASNVAAVALASLTILGAGAYFGGCGDNEQHVGNQSAPTAETGPTGSIGQ